MGIFIKRARKRYSRLEGHSLRGRFTTLYTASVWPVSATVRYLSWLGCDTYILLLDNPFKWTVILWRMDTFHQPWKQTDSSHPSIVNEIYTDCVYWAPHLRTAFKHRKSEYAYCIVTQDQFEVHLDAMGEYRYTWGRDFCLFVHGFRVPKLIMSLFGVVVWSGPMGDVTYLTYIWLLQDKWCQLLGVPEKLP